MLFVNNKKRKAEKTLISFLLKLSTYRRLEKHTEMIQDSNYIFGSKLRHWKRDHKKAKANYIKSGKTNIQGHKTTPFNVSKFDVTVPK